MIINTEEFFKQNTARNGKSRNNRHWSLSDPIDNKANKSNRAAYRSRLAELAEQCQEGF